MTSLRWAMVGVLMGLGCDEQDEDDGEDECEVGDVQSCGLDDPEFEDLEDTCVEHDGKAQWTCSFEEFCECATPLVLSFDGAEPVVLAGTSAAFDISLAGGCLSTDWPEARTPWLALDRDGDGGIADGRELFGSGTRLESGRRAAHGFEALAELDDNADGVIDVRDPAFGKLLTWADDDLDRRGAGLELGAAAGRLLAIELGYTIDRRCDDRGNCGVERASFTWIDDFGAVRKGEVVDLHLACQ